MIGGCDRLLVGVVDDCGECLGDKSLQISWGEGVVIC